MFTFSVCVERQKTELGSCHLNIISKPQMSLENATNWSLASISPREVNTLMVSPSLLCVLSIVQFNNFLLKGLRQSRIQNLLVVQAFPKNFH